MVVMLNRLLRGSHVGKDIDTGKQRLYISNAVLERTKQVPPSSTHDIVKQEVKGEDDPLLFSRRWPERFELVRDGSALGGDPDLLMKPNETLNQFAARIAELAKTRGSITSSDAAPAGLQTAPMQPSGAPPSTNLPPTDMSTFDSMTVKDLQAHAEAEEIDLKGASKKDDIIRVLKASYGV